MCVTVCCIHRSQTCLFQHTPQELLCLHLGKFRLKAGRHRRRKRLENRNISGGLGRVEVTEVMLRNMLSFIGYMTKGNSCLSESSYCRLYTEIYIQFLKMLIAGCLYSTIYIVLLVLFSCNFLRFKCSHKSSSQSNILYTTEVSTPLCSVT